LLVADVYEAVGHAQAYDYLYQLAANKTPDEQDLPELHRLFYLQINNEHAGKYRNNGGVNSRNGGVNNNVTINNGGVN